jgi:hypothetical protein
MSKLTKENVTEALEITGGMPTHAAKLLGVSYSAIHSFMKKNPKFKAIREASRYKLHEELESLSVFVIKTGYLQIAVLDEQGKPTSETKYVEVDVRKRLNLGAHLLRIYKNQAGIKDELDITTKGKEIKGKITVIELPEILRKTTDL